MSVELTSFEAFRVAELRAERRALSDEDARIAAEMRALIQGVAKRTGKPEVAGWGFFVDAENRRIEMRPPEGNAEAGDDA